MFETQQPRQALIHQSANRHNLLLGADREIVLVTVMIAVGLAFSLGTWWGLLLALAFWLAAVAILQRLGKADPLMRMVYLRHIRYRAFYPAKSGIRAVSSETPRSWR